MQREAQTVEARVFERERSVGGVDHNQGVLVALKVTNVRVELHHDDSGDLVWTFIQERQVVLYVLERRHPEQFRAVADLHELAKRLLRGRDVCRCWSIGRVA